MTSFSPIPMNVRGTRSFGRKRRLPQIPSLQERYTHHAALSLTWSKSPSPPTRHIASPPSEQFFAPHALTVSVSCPVRLDLRLIGHVKDGELEMSDAVVALVGSSAADRRQLLFERHVPP